METVVCRNRSLPDLLERAASDELELIADLITDKGNGRMALDRNIKTLIMRRKEAGTLQSISDILDEEIRAFGGNSIANLTRRSQGVAYDELATDVATKLGVALASDMNLYDIEQSIITKALAKFSTGLPEVPASTSRSAEEESLALTLMVKSLIDSSSSFTDLIGNKSASSFGSTVGGRIKPLAKVAAALLVSSFGQYETAGPAFRITIPAAIHVANIRRKQMATEMELMREELKACL